jgi:DNA topoisomerase-6 subunit B
VWVPFTSESKEAIADYDEIRKEMKLALMECGRKLGTYLRKRQKMRREGERRDVFERYIGEISKAIHEVTGEDQRKVFDALLKQAKARTAVADQVLDEDGKVVKDEPMDEDGVIVVPEAMSAAGAPAPAAPAEPATAAKPGRRAKAAPDAEAAARPRRAAARPSKASAAREELRARVAKARSGGKGGAAGPDLF